MKLLKYIILAALIVLVMLMGVYPVLYIVYPQQFGILRLKSASLLLSPLWNAAFYLHIFFGGIALLTGWPQFVRPFRKRYIALHRTVGKIYVIAVIVSGTATLYLAPYAQGGIIAAAGFTGLGLAWLGSTVLAYTAIRKGDIHGHGSWVIFSYAATLSAVTLRLWSPILHRVFHDFDTSYNIVSWLCWVPNLLVAAWLVKRRERQLRPETSARPRLTQHTPNP